MTIGEFPRAPNRPISRISSKRSYGKSSGRQADKSRRIITQKLEADQVKKFATVPFKAPQQLKPLD